jgi:molybdopterin-binding protein
MIDHVENFCSMRALIFAFSGWPSSARPQERGHRLQPSLPGRGIASAFPMPRPTDEAIAMDFSAGNVLIGRVAKVKKGETTAVVLINLGGAVVATPIANIAVDDLKLAPGLTAYVVINATDVLIGID